MLKSLQLYPKMNSFTGIFKGLCLNHKLPLFKLLRFMKSFSQKIQLIDQTVYRLDTGHAKTV